MGEVYLARDTVLGRSVAVKILPSERSVVTERIRRFLAEAKTASALNHPYIATVHELGEADGLHFIVMEHVDGETLKAKVARGPLKPSDIIKLATQIAEALDVAHDAGIIHRDIKSSNIMVTSRGHAKVLDFGLAKQTLRETDVTTFDATPSGALVGTLSYMSPEQALGKGVDRQSDLFSVGVVLYEMATGCLPFTGSTWYETINNIVHTNPTSIRSINPRIPRSLERVIFHCLEKEVDQRVHTAAELVTALRQSGSDSYPRSGTDLFKNNLPHQLTRFVGRQREIAECRRALRHTRLLTLTGPGGIGKTRLALQVALDSVRDYVDGVWFVELASLTDAGLVPQTVASGLGVSQKSGRPTTDSLKDFLTDKSLLLLLDNCEHLVDACAQLSEGLLLHSPSLRVLATSREPLAIDGETVFRVPSLGLPNSQPTSDLDSFQKHEAVELFVDRARLVKSTFAIDSARNARLVAKLCAQLDGIPLAIELAASRMKVLSLEQIVDRLTDRLSLLTGGSRTALPRHQNLLAAIEWSYNLLAEPERILFRRLSVFSGGWTLEAAENVCIGDGVAKAGVLGLLSGLVDKSLVLTEERDGQQRYRFMVVLQEYARKHLMDAGEECDIARLHAQFYLSLALEHESKLRGGEQKSSLKQLNAEHDNMRAVLNWTWKADPELGLRLAGTLGRFWSSQGYWHEGREWLTKMLEANGTVANAGYRAKALNAAAWLADDLVSSRAFAQDALILARQAGDKWESAAALNHLGIVAGKKGDFTAAGSLLEESLAVRRELGDKGWIAVSLNNIGILAFRQGDFISARSHFEETLAIFRDQADEHGTATALLNLGELARRMGDHIAARALVDEGLALATDLSDKTLIPIALNSLGNLAGRVGEYEAAHAFHSESLEVSRALGDRQLTAMTLLSFGIIVEQRAEYQRARSLFEQSLAIRRELGERPEIAAALNCLGRISTRQADHATARSLHNEALAIYQESGAKDGIAQSLTGLADVARLEADYVLAMSLYKQSLTMSWELGEAPELLRPLEHLAAVLGDRGRHACAARIWGISHALRAAMSMPRPPAETDEYDLHILSARTALGETDFAAAWEEGLTMATDKCIGDMLKDKDIWADAADAPGTRKSDVMLT